MTISVLSWLSFALFALMVLVLGVELPDSASIRQSHRLTAALYQQRQIDKNCATPPPRHRQIWRDTAWARAMVQWDHATFRRINGDWNNRLFDALMPAVTTLGLGHVQALLLLGVWFWARWRRELRWRATAILGWVMVAVGITAPLLKLMLPRCRPPAVLPYDTILLVKPLYGGSFPSGHTLTAFGVMTVVAVRHPWTAPWAFGIAAMVGLSRISVGVHWPLDVIFSAFLGTALGWLVCRRLGPVLDGTNKTTLGESV